MASSKPVLGYWHIRGLASQVRLMLHYAEVDFEDKVYEIGPAPEHNKDCWFSVKQTLGLDFPNLPYFFDGDVNLTETAAIMKYIARKWSPGLLGHTPVEYATSEMLAEFVGQLKRALTMPSYTGGDFGKDITCQQLAESAYPHLERVLNFKKSKGHKWLAGENLTWIDFFFWEIVDYLAWLTKGGVVEKYPELGHYHKEFLALPTIAKVWGDDVKCQKYPWNNSFALIGGRDSTIMP